MERRIGLRGRNGVSCKRRMEARRSDRDSGDTVTKMK